MAHVAQARAYLTAADAADVLMQPLLRYHAVLALTRALIVFRDRTLREAALAKAHGLSGSSGKRTCRKESAICSTREFA